MLKRCRQSALPRPPLTTLDPEGRGNRNDKVDHSVKCYWHGMVGQFGGAHQMIIMKHIEYEIADFSELRSLLDDLQETTSRVPGVTLREMYFPRGREEFVLALECTSEDNYLKWRKICPPPPGAKDWCEVLLTKDERFPK